MEKFRIALYGMAQVTAIVYGVLASGATVKFNRYWLDQGYSMPSAYYWAVFYRDYGYHLLFLVVIWALAMSYFSSHWGNRRFEEREISISGIALTVTLALLGTTFAIWGAQEPPHSTFITQLK
jgi:hypothetical protein